VVVLDVGINWSAIPCWSGRAQRWVHQTVPLAYQVRYHTEVRPKMPHNPVSLKSVIAVAEARASFADHRTGRECRPTNRRLAALTGLSVRTVQRASTALRLLGVATEVSRGRQRTKAERFASWRVGDRGRGWASVWALHDSRITSLSSHPGGSFLPNTFSSKSSLTTHNRPKKAGRCAAERRRSPDPRAAALANRWVQDPQSPSWARRFHTGTPWAHILAGPAAHGWTARDLNQLIRDWVGTGHRLPAKPHKPIGLLGAILAAHANLDERPAALDVAREQAEVVRRRADREAAALGRQRGTEALSGPGRRAALQATAALARRSADRKADELAQRRAAAAELDRIRARTEIARAELAELRARTPQDGPLL
jgi:hypothetical protein